MYRTSLLSVSNHDSVRQHFPSTPPRWMIPGYVDIIPELSSLILPCYCVWKPTEVSEVVQLLTDAKFMHTKVRRFAAQPRECGEDSRRWARRDRRWKDNHTVLSKLTGSDSVRLRQEPHVHKWIDCVGLNMIFSINKSRFSLHIWKMWLFFLSFHSGFGTRWQQNVCGLP